jgi:hypothetical protein
MNMTKSDPLIEAVGELRRMFPDFRFAQLVLAIACSAGAMEAGEVYDVEDDALLAAARHMIEFNPERREIAISGTAGIAGSRQPALTSDTCEITCRPLDAAETGS